MEYPFYLNTTTCGTRSSIVIGAKFKAFVQTSNVWITFTTIWYITALCEKTDVKHLMLYELWSWKLKSICRIICYLMLDMSLKEITCFPMTGKLVQLIRRKSKRQLNKIVTTRLEYQSAQTQCEVSNMRTATSNKVTFQDWQVCMTLVLSNG